VILRVVVMDISRHGSRRPSTHTFNSSLPLLRRFWGVESLDWKDWNTKILEADGKCQLHNDD
jgi:hypothetical protein